MKKVKIEDEIIIHYDADLYSSTLYCLTQLHYKLNFYYAIFDEFTGDESRALSNYISSYGAKVTFLARTRNKYNHTQQLFCKIEPTIPVKYWDDEKISKHYYELP